MDVQHLPITHIFRRQDARPVDESSVRSLVESIRVVGIMNPLRVRPATKHVDGEETDAFEVIAGGHRLRAARKLGLDAVPCVVVNDDDLLAELAMIDENLCRAELGPAEKAKQTARRKTVYESLHPETRNGATGGGHDQLRQLGEAAIRFTNDTSLATGKSERSVQRDAERGQKISERALSLVAGTSLDTGSYLDKLKKLGPHEQEARVQRELAEVRKPVSPAPVPRNEFESFQTWLTKLTKVFEAGSQEWRERAQEHLYPDSPVMDRRFGA